MRKIQDILDNNPDYGFKLVNNLAVIHLTWRNEDLPDYEGYSLGHLEELIRRHKTYLRNEKLKQLGI